MSRSSHRSSISRAARRNSAESISRGVFAERRKMVTASATKVRQAAQPPGGVGMPTRRRWSSRSVHAPMPSGGEATQMVVFCRSAVALSSSAPWELESSLAHEEAISSRCCETVASHHRWYSSDTPRESHSCEEHRSRNATRIACFPSGLAHTCWLASSECVYARCLHVVSCSARHASHSIAAARSVGHASQLEGQRSIMKRGLLSHSLALAQTAQSGSASAHTPTPHTPHAAGQ
mmetsp:Transcript_32584/g.81104  ORF Transcript_32584/g.81104 Transcript_32584/m.81104 type:complete len:235 (-) Transcript_32584:141-845(-)